MLNTLQPGKSRISRAITRSKIKRTWPLILMLLLPLALLIIFRYIPLAGLRLALCEITIRSKASGLRTGLA